MGLAVYNSITLDIRFPPCCYKKLLSPPIIPSDQNTPVGICSVTTDDLCQIMPVSIKSLVSYSLMLNHLSSTWSLSPSNAILIFKYGFSLPLEPTSFFVFLLPQRHITHFAAPLSSCSIVEQALKGALPLIVLWPWIGCLIFLNSSFLMWTMG